MPDLLPAMFVLLALAMPLRGDHNEGANEATRNKALLAKFYEEVWNRDQFDFADEVFADDYVRHDPRGGNPPPGPRGQKLIAQSFRKGCPDCVMKVTRLVAEDDIVVGQWRITGTSASGQKIDFVGVNIARFRDGRIVEIWNHRDDLAYMQQMGRVTIHPSPEPASKP
ncbi:MAG TPA: ester cyclase [Thermoanaerobaculia bacterium]|nr:ester cyclase [Thermoanaerobaculia bacterium]